MNRSLTGNIFGVQQPFAPDLDKYAISDDSSSVFSMGSSQNYQSRVGRRPEEGEVLAMSGLEQSPGEIKYFDSIKKPHSRAYDDEEVKDIQRPVYDSSEGPQLKGPKGIRKGVLTGDSFGNPLLLSQNQLGQRKPQVPLNDNFMDEQDSALESSGEINPALLK